MIRISRNRTNSNHKFHTTRGPRLERGNRPDGIPFTYNSYWVSLTQTSQNTLMVSLNATKVSCLFNWNPTSGYTRPPLTDQRHSMSFMFLIIVEISVHKNSWLRNKGAPYSIEQRGRVDDTVSARMMEWLTCNTNGAELPMNRRNSVCIRLLCTTSLCMSRRLDWWILPLFAGIQPEITLRCVNISGEKHIGRR